MIDMAIVVDPKGIGMSDKDAGKLAEQIRDKTPYARKEVLVCLKCNKLIADTDISLLSHYMCDKCWQEMMNGVNPDLSFKGLK
jgi:hypothetical protein